MTAFDDVDLGDYDTDKSTEYLDYYRTEIGHLTGEPIRILELGVRHGGSLLLWRDLFPYAQIAGLDVAPVTVPDETGRLHVYQGFQQDGALLDRIASEIAPEGFDLIIDDASHIGQFTAVSFWHLFPRHLKPGGFYVLEDWSCAYWPEWVDGHAYESPSGETVPGAGVAPVAGAGRREALYRNVRAAGPSVSARLDGTPRLKSAMKRMYAKVERAAVQTHFPSHNFGMVGFVKQLVDACAIDVIRRGAEGQPPGQIRYVKVAPSQVFVRKNTR